MTSQGNDGADKAKLQQQMNDLLAGLQAEPLPAELRALADKLQAALARHQKAARPPE